MLQPPPVSTLPQQGRALPAHERVQGIVYSVCIVLAPLAMMLGRPKSYIWRLTATKSIPHRRLDGVIVFVLGEVRAWVRKHEVVG